MSSRRVVPPQPQKLGPQEVKPNAEALIRSEQEMSQRRARALQIVSAAQLIIALAVVLALFYVGRTVLVTLMVSVLVAFILAPLVNWLERVSVPRWLASFLAILLLLAITYGASYFFYNRAVGFIEELPKYSQQIKGVFSHVVNKTNQLQQVSEKVLSPDQKQQKAMPVAVVRDEKNNMITRNIGAFTEIVFTAAFIPFLVYFMLSWQEHARTKTVELFPAESRTNVYVTLGQISMMIRGFIAGNFMIGLFMAICSLVVFAFLRLPYFYFLGIISGFLSLVPYLGVVLAMVPPLAAGLGILKTTGMVIVIVTVVGLHLVSVNILYPKVIGRRLQLNPLVVTIGLLIWGLIWGAWGLILAVPMLGAIKIICDHVPDLRAIGAWMGE
ncbi:MAG TPA: AI-2E family transporter [Candidatus Angelobacter sp.]